MERVAIYCAENNVTFTQMLELSLTLGMADPALVDILAQYNKKVALERRERRLASRRMYRLRKLL